MDVIDTSSVFYVFLVRGFSHCILIPRLILIPPVILRGLHCLYDETVFCFYLLIVKIIWRESWWGFIVFYVIREMVARPLCTDWEGIIQWEKNAIRANFYLCTILIIQYTEIKYSKYLFKSLVKVNNYFGQKLFISYRDLFVYIRNVMVLAVITSRVDIF